jgi:hypothetical protein
MIPMFLDTNGHEMMAGKVKANNDDPAILYECECGSEKKEQVFALALPAEALAKDGSHTRSVFSTPNGQKLQPVDRHLLLKSTQVLNR